MRVNDKISNFGESVKSTFVHVIQSTSGTFFKFYQVVDHSSGSRNTPTNK